MKPLMKKIAGAGMTAALIASLAATTGPAVAAPTDAPPPLTAGQRAELGAVLAEQGVTGAEAERILADPAVAMTIPVRGDVTTDVVTSAPVPAAAAVEGTAVAPRSEGSCVGPSKSIQAKQRLTNLVNIELGDWKMTTTWCYSGGAVTMVSSSRSANISPLGVAGNVQFAGETSFSENITGATGVSTSQANFQQKVPGTDVVTVNILATVKTTVRGSGTASTSNSCNIPCSW